MSLTPAATKDSACWPRYCILCHPVFMTRSPSQPATSIPPLHPPPASGGRLLSVFLVIPAQAGISLSTCSRQFVSLARGQISYFCGLRPHYLSHRERSKQLSEAKRFRVRVQQRHALNPHPSHYVRRPLPMGEVKTAHFFYICPRRSPPARATRCASASAASGHSFRLRSASYGETGKGWQSLLKFFNAPGKIS